MAVKQILQLGDPCLYKAATRVRRQDLTGLRRVIADMHDTLMNFRIKYGFGRAIAAPQIGVSKRLIYMYIDEPVVFINPVLSKMSRKTIAIRDNCMSFPFLEVRVRRHASCTITCRDLRWNEISERLKGDLSELLQHEVDHLDGILAVQRATDNKSFAVRR